MAVTDDPVKLIQEVEQKLHNDIATLGDALRKDIERLRLDIDERLNQINSSVRDGQIERARTRTDVSKMLETLGRLDERVSSTDNAISRLVDVTDRLDQSISKLDVTTARLEESISGMDRKFDLVVDRIDDRIEARVSKHTWIMLGGMAAALTAVAGIVALFQ